MATKTIHTCDYCKEERSHEWAEWIEIRLDLRGKKFSDHTSKYAYVPREFDFCSLKCMLAYMNETFEEGG